MKADFSGYATKAGLLCSDGRTIMPDAFKHQDKMQVPLVWQHGHTDPENVLGHAILENRSDGVYTYGFFNNSPKAVHTKTLLEHGDIKMLSIWANQLVERAKMVFHGAIREVSLVLSGANPGALIENVTIRHSDGDEQTLDDEVIIYTGLELEHSVETKKEDVDKTGGDKETFQQVYDSMTDKQKEVVHSMLGDALDHAAGGQGNTSADGETIQDIYDSMNPKQKEVLHYMLGQALESASGTAKQDNLNKDDTNDTAGHGETEKEGNNTMTRNVFEKGEMKDQHALSHDDMKALITSATQGGGRSLKSVVDEYALEHGITDIDTLFPDAKTVGDVPDWQMRRMEWVSGLLAAARKSPFARIKTYSADITMEEARAKGYVTGTMKKEEFFTVARRITTPTTIYKKQALDRDDLIDITDFDVVAWLKMEMRIMLDEELARAMLIGDGRDISSEDKINEQNIRPISKDNELYTTVVTVNVSDASSSMNEVLDAVIANRYKLKGTGMPTFFTTEFWIARFMMIRDNNGVRMYRTLGDLAAELRVGSVVAVEVMLEEPDIIGIIVNPTDYVLGADKGGEVSMFDDFDIDYNKQKYLIETRVSGALAKLKSAMVLRSAAATDVVVSPAAPSFNPVTGALSITNTTGVVYKHDGTAVNAAGSPYTVAPGTTWVIDATPAAGYYFGTSDDDQWSFTADA
jgi:uncharacterized glyoxalase superfamily protein PhnB